MNGIKTTKIIDVLVLNGKFMIHWSFITVFFCGKNRHSHHRINQAWLGWWTGLWYWIYHINLVENHGRIIGSTMVKCYEYLSMGIIYDMPMGTRIIGDFVVHINHWNIVGIIMINWGLISQWGYTNLVN